MYSGYKSKMPPRSANSPGAVTIACLVYPICHKLIKPFFNINRPVYFRRQGTGQPLIFLLVTIFSYPQSE